MSDIDLDLVRKKNVQRLMDERGWKQPELARRYSEKGVSQAFISQLLATSGPRMKNIGKRCQKKLAKAFNCSENEFIRTDWMQIDDPVEKYICPTTNDENVIVLKHIEVVNKFKNKQLALDINSDLFEIEQISPEELRDLGTLIRGTLRGLKRLYGKTEKTSG